MATWIDKLFDRTQPGLEKALDLTWRRNEAISANITNAETPGYRAVDVTFAGELDKAFGEPTGPIATTNAKHLDLSGEGTAHLVANLTGATKPDGNNVDIDIEMGRLAANSGKYSIAAGIMRKKLQDLKEAIRSTSR